MNRVLALAVCLLSLVLIAGCGPSITVQNRTGIGVRAILVHAGGRAVLSPSPGESSSAEVDEGPYSVAVTLDNDWIEYAKLTRKVLNEQLANADNLSGPQLLEVVRRLKDIATRMQAFEQAGLRGASCRGNVSSDGGGSVEVSQGPSGALVVSCK